MTPPSRRASRSSTIASPPRSTSTCAFRIDSAWATKMPICGCRRPTCSTATPLWLLPGARSTGSAPNTMPRFTTFSVAASPWVPRCASDPLHFQGTSRMTDFTRSSLTRRATLKTIGAGAIGAAAVTALPTFAQSSGRKPNFLFIMADDLGYADLSCYGRREYQTPILDRLAAQGVRFTNGYANSAVCSPTRVALITGRYQYRIAAGLHEPLRGNAGLDPAHPTLPSLLRAHGYHTALIGKWHLGNLPSYGPLQSGYDEFWGNRGGAIDYFTHGSRDPDLWDGDVPIEETGYYTDMLADRSVKFLDERAKESKPWLLSLHFTAPHWPWQGPDDQAESERI